MKGLVARLRSQAKQNRDGSVSSSTDRWFDLALLLTSLKERFVCRKLVCRFAGSAVAACLGLVLLMVPALAQAQYQLTNLVSNQLDAHATTSRSTAGQSLGISPKRRFALVAQR